MSPAAPYPLPRKRSTEWACQRSRFAVRKHRLTLGRRKTPPLLLPKAGAVRPDADAGDVIRLVHAVSIATEKAADPGQADRMLALILDGLRPQPVS